MKLNIPTLLTLLRILLLPILVIVFYLPIHKSGFYCALIFMIAAITDWFDGFLARKLKQATRFGAFLDPVADKIMVALTLTLLTEHYHSLWITLPAVIMISREIIISALREWMAEIGNRGKVAVSIIGKVKTATQMLALTLLLWRPSLRIETIGFVSLYLAVILTLWSMYQYLLVSRSSLLEDE